MPAAEEDIAAGELLICERPMDLVRPGVARLTLRDCHNSRVGIFRKFLALELKIPQLCQDSDWAYGANLEVHGVPGCCRVQ